MMLPFCRAAICLLPTMVLDAQTPGGVTESTALRTMADACLQEFPEGVQLAIAVVRGKDVAFLGAERHRDGVRPVDNRKGLFEIGSITKVFTATLLAQEVVAGRLRLEDPVQPLLPFTLKGRPAITLKQLASHTSGMAHHQPPGLNRHAFFHGHSDDPYRCFNPAAFEGYFQKDLELAATPGTTYQYTNLGMSLLGYALCRSTGKDYETLLQERIFRPLGMASSTSLPEQAKNNRVGGRRGKGERAPDQPMNALAPAGAILSSAEDLARFVQAHFAPASAAFNLTGQVVKGLEPGYHVGLGWHLVDQKDATRWLNHNGGMEGYTASVNVSPQRGLGVVVLCNYRNDDTRGEAVRALARKLLRSLEAEAALPGR